VVIEAVPGEAGLVEVRVHDNGPGFQNEQVDAPSVPFTTTKADGLGVGLALSRSIVEAHGGRLWVGKTTAGAIVHFTLPVAETTPI
jgi:two-component system, LuxR family, sensor kinase FixL